MKRWSISKYWMVFKVAVSERMVYRTDFFVSTFLRFIPIITTILLWRAIYDGAEQARIGGLAYTEMVGYFLFVMIARAFGSMPGLASGIAADVREGELRKFLLQPIDYVSYTLVLRAAHKLVYYILAAAPFIVVFWMCRRYLPGWPPPAMLALYLCSLLLAFAIGFTVNCVLGLLAFWFLEIGSLLYVFMILQYFLSGHMFPLSLLPAGLRDAVTWLPFAYETYYPSMIILQKFTLLQAAGVVAVQAAWVAVLAVLGRWVWRRGLRRYAAFGG